MASRRTSRRRKTTGGARRSRSHSRKVSRNTGGGKKQRVQKDPLGDKLAKLLEGPEHKRSRKSRKGKRHH